MATEPVISRTVPRRPGRWRSAGIVVTAAAHGVLIVLATVLVVLNTQGLCGEPAGSGSLREARLDLLVVVLLAAVPWLVAALVASRRGHRWGTLLATAVLVSIYPAYSLGSALAASPADWTISWCLF